jgi:hypothetical protein
MDALAGPALVGVFCAVLWMAWRLQRVRARGRAAIARDEAIGSREALATELREHLEAFRDYRDLADEWADGSLVPEDDEHLLGELSGAALVEMREAREAGAVGEAQPDVVDTGRLLITTLRAVFTGGSQVREWRWAKLASHRVETRGGASVLWLAVTNRQRLSGILTDPAAMRTVARRVAFGVAVQRGRGDAHVAALEAELAALGGGSSAAGPTPPPSPPGA